LLKYSETQVQELRIPAFSKHRVRLLVKREDLNHAFVSGNKWWKLKYNLQEAMNLKKETMLTFGGAFSNHIYATAAAAKELGLKSIGIIRGEETLPLNSTLSFAKEQGMKLHYVSRESYRKKNQADFIARLQEQFGDFYLIPEGGTNELAVKGCAELGEKLLNEIEFDYLCLPVGTGGTVAGIVSALKGKRKVIGFSSLKGGAFLREEIEHLLKSKRNTNWTLNSDFHFGGYAKMTDELKEFIIDLEKNHSLSLDPVYTSKMVYGIFKLIESNYFKKDSTILILHTGGMQGRTGFNF